MLLDQTFRLELALGLHAAGHFVMRTEEAGLANRLVIAWPNGARCQVHALPADLATPPLTETPKTDCIERCTPCRIAKPFP
jgi:hypothetical protein